MADRVAQMIERAQVLADRRVAWNRTIAEYKQIHIPNPGNRFDTNTDVGPIASSFVAAGNNTMQQTINFTDMEFNTLYLILQDNILTTYNVGCGKKKSTHPMDALFISILQLQSGSQWEESSQTFGLKTSSHQ